MFIDASAMTAIILRESDVDALVARIEDARTPLISSPLAMFETTLAVANRRRISTIEARERVGSAFADAGVRIVDITPEIGQIALDARARYGKGTRHPAQLNRGDCFAYACAKAHGAALLYKGDDFVHTDLA